MNGKIGSGKPRFYGEKRIVLCGPNHKISIQRIDIGRMTHTVLAVHEKEHLADAVGRYRGGVRDRLHLEEVADGQEVDLE